MAEERLRAALSERRDRGRHPAGVPAPAHPHLRDGLDRQGRATVRTYGTLLDQPQPPAAVRLHDPQPEAPNALARRMDEPEARIAALREQEEIDAIRPPLDGRQVMQHLGIPPSRLVGEALDALLEERPSVARSTSRRHTCCSTHGVNVESGQRRRLAIAVADRARPTPPSQRVGPARHTTVEGTLACAPRSSSSVSVRSPARGGR